MGQNESVVAVVLLALLAANWPFLTQRLFGVLRLASGKSLFDVGAVFFAGLFVEGAEGAFHLDGVGDDVAAVSAVDGAEGEDAGLHGGDAAGVDRLQHVDALGGSD